MIHKSVVAALSLSGMFGQDRTYVLCDGQFGSTGKGLAADLLEQYDVATGCRVTVVGTNAGPNSGHTAILENGDKVFTQQIPVFSACRGLRKDAPQPLTVLNGGAVIDMQYVEKESNMYNVNPVIHGSAAMITAETVAEFSTTGMDKIASTGKGVGQAMAAKALRMAGAVYKDHPDYPFVQMNGAPNYSGHRVLLECAQGFSLGVNSGFFPYTTSRECSVPQALADAGVSPLDYGGGMMVLRTFPIRVGNTDKGNSGPCYPDQKEITWEEIGKAPELTSVTKRVRRVFTFSMMQAEEAYRVNRPSAILLNFCNYLENEQLAPLVDMVKRMCHANVALLLGFGPKVSNIVTHHDWLRGARPDKGVYPAK